MAQKVGLVWYCRTPNGWRRFPVVLGGNNRIKHGFVKVAGKLLEYPEGRYQIRSYEDRKKVYRNAGDSAADAMAALHRAGHLIVAKKSAEAAGVKVIEETGRVVLRRMALKFEDDARERGALEAADLNRHVTAEFLAATGLVYADEVTRESVLKFHKYLRTRGNGDRTVNNKHKRLMSFFTYCKMDKSDMPPAPRYETRIPTAYTKDDNGRILGAADDYMKMVIELGLKCGLRDQELMHLEWSDIHFEDAILRIASKPHWGFKVKDSEERDIPIPSDLVASLKARRKAHPKDVLVLPTENKKPNTKLLRMLKRRAKRAELNCGVCVGCIGPNKECQRWTLHKLRRSYATTLLRNGVDLATVQRYMGHADLESTMRYLSPATAKESQKAVNAIKWT